jgi:hypothetical protein
VDQVSNADDFNIVRTSGFFSDGFLSGFLSSVMSEVFFKDVFSLISSSLDYNNEDQ